MRQDLGLTYLRSVSVPFLTTALGSSRTPGVLLVAFGHKSHQIYWAQMRCKGGFDGNLERFLKVRLGRNSSGQSLKKESHSIKLNKSLFQNARCSSFCENALEQNQTEWAWFLRPCTMKREYSHSSERWLGVWYAGPVLSILDTLYLVPTVTRRGELLLPLFSK